MALNIEHPGISVVIPTVGRKELARAIASARDQKYPGPIELIVVADLPEGTLEASLVQGADITLYTGGGRRGGAARNLGIRAASYDYVALLDDDDQWMPWKLSVQVKAFSNLRVDIVGTRSVYRNPGTETTSAPVPTSVKHIDQPVYEYLFLRRGPRVGRPVIYTSTLMVRTKLAKQVQWDESLKRHQDWDWVDRLERSGGRIAQIPDPSTVIWTGSVGSISSSSDWESSITWAETRRQIWDPKVLSDFLAGQTFRYTLQARSASGIRRTIAAIVRTGRIPSAQTFLLGLSGIVPRMLINRLLSR
ncbi:glycosyltransferase family 2 protein [Leucobacter sp. W1153]|uniref:glycosyltransferase family 2 protein n=1 Tax=Leucobacter sp. W1153 TaxID=3439064 RepID=UPI003F31A6F8